MKSHKLFILFTVFYVLLLFIIFHEWFTLNLLSATDLPLSSKLLSQYRPIFPFAWDPVRGNGMGGNTLALLWNYVAQVSPDVFLGKYLHIDWVLIERMLYFYPLLIIASISSYLLCRQLVRNIFFAFIGPFVYILNTYFLLVIGGGQVMIALAYAITPIILLIFSKITNSKHSLLLSFFASLFLAIETLMDFRIAFIAMFAFSIYWVINHFIYGNIWSKKVIYSFLFTFVVPGIIVLMLNAFWLLPVLLIHQNPVTQLGSAYSTIGAVKYFSFAKFENTIGILHPYWPENIFGKVSFMKPEFLVIPILAFSALLFLNKKDKREKQYVLYFAFLGLIGAYLAKGANDPFGFVYLWMFQHVPGFVMFRDPTKWYTLVALSYSVLIPFSVWKIYEWLAENLKINIRRVVPNLFIILFLVFWLFTIRQAVFGQLGGTFKQTSVPSEYISLANFLANQQQFYRTLWIPTSQRFGYYSIFHPQIAAQDLLNIYDENGLLKRLNQPATEKHLQEMGVRYVIVPNDSQREIFLKDRTYSEALYKKTIADVSKISWLKRSNSFANLAVFEVANSKDHFWSPSPGLQIQYSFINPVTYTVHVANAHKGDRLVFAESFDQHWTANVLSSKNQVSSVKYDNLQNSFVLPKNGSYSIDVYYTPQRWVDIGLGISLATVVLIGGGLLYYYMKRKETKV